MIISLKKKKLFTTDINWGLILCNRQYKVQKSDSGFTVFVTTPYMLRHIPQPPSKLCTFCVMCARLWRRYITQCMIDLVFPKRLTLSSWFIRSAKAETTTEWNKKNQQIISVLCYFRSTCGSYLAPVENIHSSALPEHIWSVFFLMYIKDPLGQVP